MATSDNYNLEDEEDNGNDFGFSLILLSLRQLLTPVQSWKEIKRLHIPSQKMNCYCLFPMIGVAAVAKLISCLFWQDNTFVQALPKTIEIICVFFFGYFITLLLAKALLPRVHSLAMETDFGRNFIAVNLTSLALFDAAYHLIPILQPVFVFLPIWTVYSITKGVRFLTPDPDIQTKTSTILSVLLIGVPIAISWFFGMFF